MKVTDRLLAANLAALIVLVAVILVTHRDNLEHREALARRNEALVLTTSYREIYPKTSSPNPMGGSLVNLHYHLQRTIESANKINPTSKDITP